MKNKLFAAITSFIITLCLAFSAFADVPPIEDVIAQTQNDTQTTQQITPQAQAQGAAPEAQAEQTPPATQQTTDTQVPQETQTAQPEATPPQTAQPETTAPQTAQDSTAETPEEATTPPQADGPILDAATDMLNNTFIQNITGDISRTNTARVELPSFDIPAKNAILVAADTGDVLYEKDPDTAVPVASITKIMTLLLTLEAVEAGKVSLSDYVPISHHAYSMGGSQIWLEPGEQFTLDELVKAICVNSANDAAVAVAEFVGGSEPAFAEMMNIRAKELGMQNTHFVNACGLDAEGHLSTARDVAIMSEALLHHPLILEYSGIWTDTLRNGQTQLVNTNKLLNTYTGITGLKTGTTSGAGVCISATATRDGTSMIAVVLGCSSGAERFEAATSLLDYGFATYEFAPFPEIESAPQIIGVTNGSQREVGIIYGTPNGVLCRKAEGKDLTATFEIAPSVKAPIMQGDEVGTVTLSLGELVLATYPIFAQDDVEKMNFGNALSLLTKALTSL